MIFWLFSFGLGAVAVLQGGLNRQIGKVWGLPTAILLNASLLLLLATVVWFSSSTPKIQLDQWKWWYFVPALCGFALIMGIPAMIPRLGATGVFLCIVVGQMSFSLLWDLWVEGVPLEPRRLVGVGIALSGLLISSWGSTK